MAIGTFNAASLVEKLGKLNSTQASIETLSEWCNFFRRDAGRVVGIWDEEFNKATPAKRLILLYLANDILQNSRKKGPEYVVEFFKVLPRDLKLGIQTGDERTMDKVAKDGQQVTRLVAVMEERKVFGTSGSNTLKELLAEAESPSKRLSARTGAPPASNGAPDAGRRGAGGVPAELSPAVAAFAASAAAAAHVSQLVACCSAVLQKDLFENGSWEDVAAACALLQKYDAALSSEVQMRDSTLEALQGLLAAQAEAKQQLEERQMLCRRQQQQFSARLAQLSGGGAKQGPPLPPLPTALGVSASASPAPGAELASASADMEVDAPVSDAQPAAAAAVPSGGSGGDDEMKAAAAALVAQLTASGDPKAILEAMAALPQDQQMEIHEQLMHHMGGGDPGGDTLLEADYNADGSQIEDEYNPDEPPFL